ncbi:hypothetical protein D6T69_11010 [Tenacibaculum singaporense]|uniref:Uncharacterized protein n=1 Tax=Tenacibaculum singaporense TaxID=2358479 RepID=A0A3Q8RP69_9FLAO|nr:hypothetical protein [Tenacibaculum singaporense]AZJ36023.1 hypothetical protein D6T69_11010 [Tenacibaculum singaporense]
MFGKRVILQLIIIVFYTITAFGQTPEYAYLVTTEVINSYNNYPITGELNMNSDVGRIEQVKYPATSSTIGNTYFDFITIPQGFSEVYIDVNQNNYMECDYSQPSETILKSDFNYGIIAAGLYMSNCNYVYNLYPLHIIGTNNVDPICLLTKVELTGGYDWEYLIGNKDDTALEWKVLSSATPTININIGDIYDKESIIINELPVDSEKRKIHFRTGHRASGKYVTPITYTVIGCSPPFKGYYNQTKTSCSYFKDGNISLKIGRGIDPSEQLAVTLFKKDSNSDILVSQYSTKQLSTTDSKIIVLEDFGGGVFGFKWPVDIDAGIYYFRYQTLNEADTPQKPDASDSVFWDKLVKTPNFTIEKATNVDFTAKWVNDESCFEAGDGKIQIEVTSGETGRSYFYIVYKVEGTTETLERDWTSFSGTTTVISGLGKGEYKIKVKDNEGCLAK